jgi:hypothetical protein
MLPPTMLQMDSKLEHAIPVPASKLNYTVKEKTNGSLSDGSVCELPLLKKVNFRRYQPQNQSNNNRQDYMLPGYRSNGMQTRKRFSSSGDKDAAASSGYETASKRSKRDSSGSPVKGFNPVMENRVSSTNHDFVYKFTGPTPAENFQVTYTIEERVRAAACAIVYNNCKISTDKFQSMFDKPAPDFKTIFAWRQQLLSTGCLVDTHVEGNVNLTTPVVENPKVKEKSIVKTPSPTVINRLPNPDEIPILSDSDEDNSKIEKAQIKSHPLSSQRSASVETLVIGGVEDTRPTGGSITTEGSRSQARSRSGSIHQQTHSSSQESSETDSKKVENNRNKARPVVNIKNHFPLPRIIKNQSTHDSDSDSISYHSEEDNFLSRVFGDGKKTKRKVKKRPIPTVLPKPQTYTIGQNHSFQGYSTAKPLEKPPLATGNIYTPNLRNMAVKIHGNHHTDNDGFSSEYVPTKLGSTTKNYQEFKNNVRRSGYWAKGNGATFGKNFNKSCGHTPRQINRPKENFSTPTHGYESIQTTLPPIRNEDFTKDDFLSVPQQYLPFEPSTFVSSTVPEKVPDNTSRVFDAVQSNSFTKNSSILDIFSMNEGNQSPEKTDIHDKEIGAARNSETVWDVDDDDLYKNSDSNDDGVLEQQSRHTSVNRRIESPVSNMLYATDNEVENENVSKNITPELIRNKQDMLLGFLNDVKSVQEKEFENANSLDRHHEVFPHKDILDKKIVPQKHIMFPIEMEKPEPIPLELSKDIMRLSENCDDESQVKATKVISPTKKVHVLESITICPGAHKNQKSVQANQNNVDQPQKNKNPITTSNNANTSQNSKESNEELAMPNSQNSQIAPNIDFSNLLAGINTNALLLALQNLQNINNVSPAENVQVSNDNGTGNEEELVETINLTNDEDWEKESNDGSIERRLQQLDGNTSDTPFLSDIFDPGPVVLPNSSTVNINLNNLDVSKADAKQLNIDETVIGSFKSFALPKPVLLSRLKLTVKPTDKSTKKSSNSMKSKKKVCILFFFINNSINIL